MRIAMVSEHASPLAVLGGQDAGGQNVHVAALAAALADRGHTVEVFTRRDEESLPDVVRLQRHDHAAFDVVHVPAGPARHLPKDDLDPYMDEFGTWLAARWADERLRPELVHAHFWMSGRAALVARELSGVPVVQTFHALGTVKRRHQGSADTSPPQRLEVERHLALNADAVVATCSDEIAELLALDAPATRLHVVPCGVDLSAFGPAGPTAPRTARPRIVAASRLVPRKGLDTLVEALAQVPEAELLVAGGPEWVDLADDPEAQRLQEVAAAHGVADRMLMLGRLDRAEMASVFRSADVVASVPWYEPFGIVPLEAMACATPVVVSAVGGMLDTVADGVSGLHVPPRDPAALASALCRVLAAPGLRARLGEGARQRAGRYSWSRVAADTEAVYEWVVSPATASRPPVGGSIDLRDTVVRPAGPVPDQTGGLL